MRRTLIKTSLFASMLALALSTLAMRPASAAPLTIGYSDWPGWVAWQVAIDKGWFKEAGVDVELPVVRLFGLDGCVRGRQDRRRL